jgi:phage terminase small subunit
MKVPNLRQELLIQQIALGRPATEAARTAGYSEAYARKSAHALLRKPHIAAAIEAIKVKLREDTIFTAEKLLAQLQFDHDKAIEWKQGPAAVRASEMIGKLKGWMVDKAHIVHEAKPSLMEAIEAGKARAALPAPTKHLIIDVVPTEIALADAIGTTSTNKD